MLAFIVQRLLQAILVMLVVALISFSLFHFVGDPINNMVGQETTAEQRAALRERLGLNDPVPVQFVTLRRARRARRVRHLLPHGQAGQRADRDAAAGDHRARAAVGGARAR